MESQTRIRRVAVTVWEQRVSPVFDAARTLLIAELSETDQGIVTTSFMSFDPDRLLDLVQALRAQDITVLICGAISEGPANVLESAGFELVAFVAGNVQQVLQTFLQGGPFQGEFALPGCGKRVCCRGKIRRGQEIGGRAHRMNRSRRQGQHPSRGEE